MQLTEALAKAIELLPEHEAFRRDLITKLEATRAKLAYDLNAVQETLAELRNGDDPEPEPVPGIDLDAELDRRGVTKHEGLYAKVRRVHKNHKAGVTKLPRPSRTAIMAWAKEHDGITVHEFVEANKDKFDTSHGYVSVCCSGCAQGGLLRRGGPGQYVITTKGKEWQ